MQPGVHEPRGRDVRLECLTSGVLRGNYLFFFSKVHRARNDPGGATMAAATTTSRKAKPQTKARGTSQRQIEANQANAKKSTGPRTAGGEAKLET